MFKKAISGIIITTGIIGATACSTSATPSECIQRAEEAGAPASVIEQLERPGELNAIERIALRKSLEKLGVADICKEV